MRFGVARDLITPAVRMHMGGYGTLQKEWFTGIHDDLFVKTLVLDDGNQRVVLITYDLLMHDFALTETIADYIQTQHGIDAEDLLVSYTHNHAGPALEVYDPGQSSPEYEAFLLDRTKSCIDRALLNVVDGEMEFGWVEGEWSINRRARVDGEMRNAPNLEGNKDRRLSILKLSDAEGACKVLLLNFACHPVTLGATLWLSAEYPGRICQLLEADFYGCVPMFFQGAGGNSRPLIAARPDHRWKDCTFGDLDGMAQSMASAVRGAVAAGRLRAVEPHLGAVQFVVEPETEVKPKSYFEDLAAREVDSPSSSGNRLRVILDRYDSTDNTVPLHAAVVRLADDLYMAMLCGEVCVEVKQEVEKAFEGVDLIFVGYGDGIAYIPDDSLIDEGGYEVDGSVVEFCLKGRFKKGINQKLREGYSAALETLPK
ncbi:MAG: neutral/alkaline non-lysosomal ceramidase N-terminal domain-containing protein [Candidatus Latescibacteria bacterium]|nr:neutral/alkaline non-lysosomal ceramidase N-terminal domain-containing protein [Candidatus Latescibacterota bacterium]